MIQSDIYDFEYQPSSQENNPGIGSRSQPVGNISIAVPADDWMYKKFEEMKLTVMQGYLQLSSYSSELRKWSSGSHHS